MTFVSFDVSQIETELSGLGVSVAELCRRAGIETSTWQRWKAERFDPQQRTAKKIISAMQGIRAERAPTQATP